MNVNGKQDSLTAVKADGTFPCYLGSKLTSIIDKVEAVGLSSNGQELGRAAVTLN
ncbi:immunoglobulin-like domain-containing protein [Listeria fleischmannii]|uniref:immunoglobulin-like domain-containing protein n=1 Tax=Listeria fleischmannii TaxID=1069827 RepID=UPI0004B3AB1E|nr:immunoglobulin-like domain-containing protein [Listeria fleischmannii]